MPFMKIGRGPCAILPAGASARLAFSQKGKAKLTLIVDRAIADKLKWKPGAPIGVEAGTEEDEGTVRLAVAVKGWKLDKHAKRDTHVSIALAAWWKADHMKGLTSSAVIECTSETKDGALIIKLPTGWFAKAGAPAAAPVSAAPAGGAAPQASRPFDMNKLSARAGAR